MLAMQASYDDLITKVGEQITRDAITTSGKVRRVSYTLHFVSWDGAILAEYYLFRYQWS